jgi:2-hydroxychromene-2-carboxylate isomerase
MAARLAIVGSKDGWIADFACSAFAAQFGKGEDISRPELLSRLLLSLGLDSEAAFARAAEPLIKDALRASTEQAISLGIFGAPSFVTEDGELFWGDDRLEQALTWARAL